MRLSGLYGIWLHVHEAEAEPLHEGHVGDHLMGSECHDDRTAKSQLDDYL